MAPGKKLTKKEKADAKWDLIGKKRKEVTKLGMRIYGGNFHDNFVDLNPDYAHEKHKRAVERAEEVVGDLSKTLLVAYREKHLKIFESNCEGGLRLSFEELQKLDDDFKAVYKKVIKAHNEEIDRYVDEVQSDA